MNLGWDVVFFGLVVIVALFALGNSIRVSVEKRHALKEIRVTTMTTVRLMSPEEFKQYAVWLLMAMGYRVSGDIDPVFGVDLIAYKDGIYWAVTLRRRTNLAGEDAIKDVFAGSAYWKATEGGRFWRMAVLTDSRLTPMARSMGQTLGVALWDEFWLTKQIDNFGREYLEGVEHE